MAYIVYRKGNLSKVAIVKTKKEAEKIKNDMYDIIQTDNTNHLITRNAKNEIELIEKEVKILTQEELNNQITNELNNTTPELMEIFEDIVDWAEKEGFILSDKKKQLMDFRKEKRKGIK